MRFSPCFFAKKACGSVDFGVNYGAGFLALTSDILTLFAIKHRGLL
jgi:hypothetical protein